MNAMTNPADTIQLLDASIRRDAWKADRRRAEITLLQSSIHRDQKRRQAVKRRVQEDGDATLFAWGDAKREGKIEAILHSRAAATEANGRPIRSAGSYSNPVEATVMAVDALALRVVLLVDVEVGWWREDRHTRIWAEIADRYYATAGHATNGSVARALKVSESVIERCRAQMRRMVLMAAQRGGLQI